MDLHEKNIQRLCRICSSVVQSKTGYITPKSVNDYSNIIYTAYSIDTDIENQEVFPKKLCHSCKRKLDRLKVKEPPYTFMEAASFYPHSENCSICVIPVKSYKSLAHVKIFTEIFQKNGFIRFENDLKENVKLMFICPVFENGKIINRYTVSIFEDFEWSLSLYGMEVGTNNSYLVNSPKILTDDNVGVFIQKIMSLNICQGITDFEDVIQHRLEIKQPFTNKNIIVAYAESKDHCRLVKENFNTIRHQNCSIFSDKGDICNECNNYQDYLRTVRSRVKKIQDNLEKRTSDTSHTNLRYLSKNELILRLENTQKQKREALSTVAKMTLTIRNMVEMEGSMLDEDTHSSFSEILENNQCGFDQDTPQGLLWQQQKEQLKKKDSRGMKWHPLIIRWCLSIYHTSPAAYKQLTSKKLQFIKLPHVNTLKKATAFTSPTTGFNADFIERLIEDSNLKDLKPFQKNVSICFDEMKIKSDLVYRKSTGSLVGYTELGGINDELKVFEKRVQKDDCRQDFATHVNVYMVRGIFSNLAYPFGFFATMGFTAQQLFTCTSTAISVIESLGFKVRALISDGAAPNRKFFAALTGEEEGNINWTTNPHDPNRKIYLMSDVPHLLKTTRNCLENSSWNQNTRHMHFEKQDISWKHIVDLYEWDLGMNRMSPGLRMLHKLKEEHIHPSPRLRMQVKLAAQVLSSTTADALALQARHDTKSTEKFIRIFDKVFDCLNVSRVGNTKGKPALEPYKTADDWRFKFLEKDFLQDYLGKWELEAYATVGMNKEEQNRLLLSKQTRHGWEMTVKSFVELGTLLLQEENPPFLLSEKFSQDPLEEHFGVQRRRGGCSENPTLFQFQNQEQVINIMGSSLVGDLRGNTRGRNIERPVIDVHDLRTLPKKKKKPNEDIEDL